VYEDALEYPFLSAMLAPFGPDALEPFEAHLRGLHQDYNHSHGGCWFRMTGPGKSRSKLAQVLETEDDSFDPEATTEGYPPPPFPLPRAAPLLLFHKMFT